jgi:hypothetical protein
MAGIAGMISHQQPAHKAVPVNAAEPVFRRELSSKL